MYYNNCHYSILYIESCYGGIMNKFDIIDEYGYEYDKVLKNVLKKALKEERVKNAVFTIVFVDNKKIRKINKEYRNIDRETDVISFAYEDNEVKKISKIRVLGEIFVSIDKMKEQAKLYGHSQTRELCFLCVHGLFHLLGYDHQTKAEENIMFKKQEGVLNGFKKTRKNW